MRAALGDAVVLDHEQAIGGAHRAQPVGDDDRRASLQEPTQRGLDHRLGHHVYAGGRLVQDDQARVGQQRAGDGDELALTDRDVGAELQDLGVVAVRQPLDEPVQADRPRGCHDRLLRGRGCAEADVVGDRARKQERILRDQRHLRTQRALLHRADVDAVDQHLPAGDVVEAGDQVGDRRLAGSGLADQRHRLSRLDGQVDVLQHGLVRLVGEGDAAQLDAAVDTTHRRGVGGVDDARLRVQQLQHLLAAGHRRLHGGVELAELLDRLEETADVGQEGDDHADRDRVPAVGEASEEQHRRRRQQPQELDRRREGERQGERPELRVPRVTIASFEPLGGRRHLRERPNHAHPADRLGQVADHRGDRRPRGAERAPRQAGKDQRGDHHHGDHREGGQRQLRVHDQHGHDDADQDQGIADDLHQPLRQHLVDGGDVVDHPRDGDADRVLGVIAQRQPLQVAEELRPHRGEHPLADPRQQVGLQRMRGIGAQERQDQEAGDQRQAPQVAGGDGVVDGELDQPRRRQAQCGDHQHGERCGGHVPAIGTQVDRQAADDVRIDRPALAAAGERGQRGPRSAAPHAAGGEGAHRAALLSTWAAARAKWPSPSLPAAAGEGAAVPAEAKMAA